MTTIATMTGDTDDAAEPDTAETTAPAARPRRTQTAPAHTDPAYGAQQRSALVPVLATVIGALIIGVFSIAAVGFNVLRSDIANVRTDMEAGFAQVDERFAQIDERFIQIDQRFAQIDTVLLDHTDRLARIEAVHNDHAHTHP
ncbi:hypothetical protein [Candidatus Poriferisodalis sp.]|uniref:hypothetical protein n=1 Tax=Candidatus Poriferisodalis sp. TaxID=3101277 RepID=UPI003B02C69B